jgi:hypothetical protein
VVSQFEVADAGDCGEPADVGRIPGDDFAPLNAAVATTIASKP